MKLAPEPLMNMETHAQLEKHEAECAVRYEYVQDKLTTLDKRLWRLEAMIMINVVAVLGTLVAIMIPTQ